MIDKHFLFPGCFYSYDEAGCEGIECRISSPGYPGIYPQNTTCTYIVSSRPETLVRISLHTLHIHRSASTHLLSDTLIIIIATRNCESHFIRFYTKTAVETLCGESREREVTFPGPTVRIEFR